MYIWDFSRIAQPLFELLKKPVFKTNQRLKQSSEVREEMAHKHNPVMLLFGHRNIKECWKKLLTVWLTLQFSVIQIIVFHLFYTLMHPMKDLEQSFISGSLVRCGL